MTLVGPVAEGGAGWTGWLTVTANDGSNFRGPSLDKFVVIIILHQVMSRFCLSSYPQLSACRNFAHGRPPPWSPERLLSQNPERGLKSEKRTPHYEHGACLLMPVMHCKVRDVVFSETARVDVGLAVELWNKGMLWDKLMGTHWLPLTTVKQSNKVCNGDACP